MIGHINGRHSLRYNPAARRRLPDRDLGKLRGRRNMQEWEWKQQEYRDRLWQHALHEDLLFNERLNSFVGFQSVLLAMAAALVLGKAGHVEIVVGVVTFIGILTSVLAGTFQWRQANYVSFLANCAANACLSTGKPLRRKSAREAHAAESLHSGRMLC
ncbi:MAG TPA: hypothetical protein VHX14_16270 [Thermoanaerobaculia bacterium]|nr:hypothetical protein [Thermoanaerobaculia bacterium]